MAHFAVIQSNLVINTIVAESKEIAEQVTNQLCVEYTESNPACIGLSYDGLMFEQPKVADILEQTE